MKYGRKIVGTCSCCRGPVIEEYGPNEVILKCNNCGATKQEDYGPVIEMTPHKVGDWTWTSPICMQRLGGLKPEYETKRLD